MINLAKPITRCRECLHSEKEARQEPCNKCSEIQMNYFKLENHFEANKNDQAIAGGGK